MAHSQDNSLVKNFNGKFDRMVYRTYGGMTIMSRLPNFTGRKWSKAQKANHRRFGGGAEYAGKAMKIPELAEFYNNKAKGLQNGWNMAVSDYMRKPEICEINLEEYKGRKGDLIRIRARDKFRVAAVIVTILNALGHEVESGMAVYLPASGWVYRAKEENPHWRGGTVVVKASDFPGNRVFERRTMSDERGFNRLSHRTGS
jgi:hypothetical protein